ncbi:hypothetical protein LEP1GSC072_3696 [Leptospira noguchii str. Bonito]|nr:hypothetical protein LEP1GSC072_3696 [Leptospira noguchii str. Bonito]
MSRKIQELLFLERPFLISLTWNSSFIISFKITYIQTLKLVFTRSYLKNTLSLLKI